MTVLAGTNNNGERVEINFPFFQGPVGLQQRQGYVEFAYIGRMPGGGTISGTIDGEIYEVLAADKSPITPGMIVVKAEAQKQV